MSDKEREQTEQNLVHAMQTLREMDADKIVASQVYGSDMPFMPVRDDLKLASDLAKMVTPYLMVTPVASRFVEMLATRAQKIVAAIERIKSFRPAGQVVPEADEIRTHVRHVVLEFADSVAVLLSIATASRMDSIGRIEGSLQLTVNGLAQDAEKKVKDAVAEVTNAVAALRPKLAATGAADEADHFTQEAKGHWWAAAAWLLVSVLLGVGLLTTLAYIYKHPAELPFDPAVTLTDAQVKSQILVAIQKVVTKLVVVSLVSGFLVFAVRNYGTSRHNYIINQHRGKALATFRAFAAGTDTTDIKDQVLVTAAKAIFSAPSTGYLRKDSGMPFGGPLVEMINAVKKE